MNNSQIQSISDSCETIKESIQDIIHNMSSMPKVYKESDEYDDLSGDVDYLQKALYSTMDSVQVLKDFIDNGV